MNNILESQLFLPLFFPRYIHSIGTCSTLDVHTHTHTLSVIPDMFTQTKLDLRVETLGPLSLPGDPPTPSFYPYIPRSLLVLLNPGEGSILGTKLLLCPSGLSVSLSSVLLGLGQFTACSYTVTSRLSSHHENIPTTHSHRWFS